MTDPPESPNNRDLGLFSQQLSKGRKPSRKRRRDNEYDRVDPRVIAVIVLVVNTMCIAGEALIMKPLYCGN